MSSVIELNLDGEGAWPDLDRDTVIHLADITIGLTVLAGGMASGRASVAFRLRLPDGRDVVAETSWRALATAAQAIAVRHGWPD